MSEQGDKILNEGLRKLIQSYGGYFFFKGEKYEEFREEVKNRA